MFDYGLESFLNSSDTRGKIALVTNDTGRDRNGAHLLERIAAHSKFELAAVFTPEHGFGSDAPDGEAVESFVHQRYKIPIISLYGTKKKPSFNDLKGINALVYDIQDVGVRFYTYISTLRNVMEAAAEAHIPFHVLDRPNLIGGNIVEGPMLSPGFESFVGHLPVPLRYGMTAAELARWWNSRQTPPADLITWPCADYRRDMPFEYLQIPWTKPSPSMKSPETARFYPGTCLYEGTNVSEGRGTKAPFQILGAPWVEPTTWLKALNPILPPTVKAEAVSFTPTFSKYAKTRCHGIYLTTSELILQNAVGIGLRSLYALIMTHPNQVEFTTRNSLQHPFFDHLVGNSTVRESLLKLILPNIIETQINEECRNFMEERRGFLIYD